MNKFKTFMVVVAVVALSGLFAVSAVSLPALAEGVADGINAIGNTGGGTDLTVVFKTIVNVLLYIIGAVSVIMIVIGAIKYVTSNGDGSAVTSAKNTILYAVIGLIVAVLAYAIVNFVVTNFVG